MEHQPEATSSSPTARAVFDHALEIASPEQRRAYLVQVCDGDPALRQKVDALLEAHEAAGSFLESRVYDLGPDATRGRPAVPRPHEGPGSAIGPYKLLEQIGEGGMGVVFLAEQTRPVRRQVALKVIKQGMDTRQVVARFESERQALAMMDHPNIARVFDAGITETGRPYFVMELVKGTSITKYCDEHRLPPRQRLELFMQVCHAVQHAHQKGIIHRDLKPTNVLVAQYDGRPVPKVIDFGVAKATGQRLTDRTMFTGFGDVIGTLEYMSPEQAELNQLDVDTRSDIYSLGVLLYELLTGSTPLENRRVKNAALLEMLRVVREEEPPKPSTRLRTSQGLPSIAACRGLEPRKLSGLVHGELDWIVMKSLEKERSRRYETANGLAMDLQRYLADEAVQACPPTARYRFRKFVRRNKGLVAVSVGTILVLLLGLVGLGISNVLITREKDQKGLALRDKQIALQSAQSSATEARTQEALANRRFYAAQLNLATAAWDRGEPARTLDLLEGQRPAFDQEDLRGFEWYYLWDRCHRGLRARLDHGAGRVYCVTYAPDGKTMLSLDGAFVRIWDAATGEPKGAFRANGWRFVVSPDGQKLATWDEKGRLRICQVDGGKELAAFDDALACAFSPDGQTIALTVGLAVEFWDVNAKERRSVLPVRGRKPRGEDVFLYNPDGNSAMMQVDNSLNRIYRRDGETWREGGDITGHGWNNVMAVSPDGKYYAVGGERLKLYSANTGVAVMTLSGLASTVRRVAFSPDGKSLASASDDRTVRTWDVATGQQRRVFPHSGPTFWVDYSPDGKTLATSGAYGMLRVWDLEAAEAPSVLTSGGGCVAMSADGTTIGIARSSATDLRDAVTGKTKISLPGKSIGVALSSDGRSAATISGQEARLWDLAAPQQPHVLGHPERLRAVAFAPDGRTLATAGDDGKARLWDVATRQTRLAIDCGANVSAVAVSPDGRTIATGTKFERVHLWDATTGRELRMLQANDPAGLLGGWTWSVAFSPGGELLATTSQTGVVRLWEVSTGRLHATLQGHTACALSVVFSPDGRTIATASEDHTIRLWDTATGQEKSTLQGHTGVVRSVAFSRDGELLISGSYDGTTRIWRAPHGVEARARKSEK